MWNGWPSSFSGLTTSRTPPVLKPPMQTPQFVECEAADQAAKEAVDASDAANIEKAPEKRSDTHLLAAAKNKKASLAAQIAAKALRARRLSSEAVEYDNRARAHETVEKLHEFAASALRPAAQSGTAVAKATFPMEEFTAKAKAHGESNGGIAGTAAMDSFLRTPEGCAYYAQYRASMLSGSSFPQKAVKK